MHWWLSRFPDNQPDLDGSITPCLAKKSARDKGYGLHMLPKNGSEVGRGFIPGVKAIASAGPSGPEVCFSPLTRNR